MACGHDDPSACVPDGAVLTQLSERTGGFRSQPRHHKERALSLILGEMGVAEAYFQVAPRSARSAPVPEGTAVRYVTAGVLRANGFTVVHAPGKIAGNPHVSVCVSSGNWRSDQQIPWEHDVAARFETCFTLEHRKEAKPNEP